MSIPEGNLYNSGILEAGKITEHHPATYITSTASEGEIPFGCAVVQGVTTGGVKVPSNVSSRMLGVSGHSFEARALEDGKYADGDVAAIVVSGVVSVRVREDVSVGDDVRVVLGTEFAGQFRKTAIAGASALVKGAEWRRESGGDGLAELFINGPFELIAD